jgi:hypothetical protein
MNNHSNKIYPKQKGQKTSFKPNPKSSYIISSIKNNNNIKKKIPLLNLSSLKSPIKLIPNDIHNKSEKEELYDNLLYIEGKRIKNNMN